MHVVQLMFVVVAMLFAVALKGFAMAEFAPLYHTLLFLPAKLAAVLSGESYTELNGTYRFSSFVLDYSCAGVNFLLLCFLASAWLFRSRVQSVLQLGLTTLALVLAAGCATNIANAFRIGLSLKLLHVSYAHAWLHEAIGTIVFITFLLAYYQLLLRFANDKTHPVR